MLLKLLRLRFILWIAIAVTLLNSAAFLILGIKHAWHGYVDIVMDTPGARPGVAFVESLDMFMIALLFAVFGFGVMRIFTYYRTVEDELLPKWLRINSFKELKILVWETILMTLVIVSVSTVVRNVDSLKWEALIIPAIVLILSASLYLMRKEEHPH